MIRFLFFTLFLACSVSAGQITVSWSPVKNAAYYEVFTATDRLSIVRRTSATKIKLDILDNQEYLFVVMAYDERGNSSKPSAPIKYIKKLKIGHYKLETPTVKIRDEY